MDINRDFIRRLEILYHTGRVKGELKTFRMIFDYYFETLTKKIFTNASKCVWMTLFVPPEIFFSMGLTMVECDLIGSWLCTLGFAEKLLSFVEQELGIGQVCTYHKVWIGALHKKLLPIPRAIITSPGCDSGQQSSNYIHETLGPELFLLDMPRIKSKESKNYLKEQLIELTSFLSDVTGTKFYLEKLKKTVHYSNTATNYWKKAQDLRIGKPLVEGLSTLRETTGCWGLHGSEEYMKIAKTLYNELKERSRNNNKILDEKCRLMWMHLAPNYITKMRTFNKIERLLGAPIVIDAATYPYFDYINEDDPFLGLAEKLMAYPMHDVLASKDEFFIKLAKKFRVDGAIQLMPLGCRVSLGTSRIIEDALNEIGIPTLHLSIDPIDSRQYSDNQERTRIEAFVESILNRKES